MPVNFMEKGSIFFIFTALVANNHEQLQVLEIF